MARLPGRLRSRYSLRSGNPSVLCISLLVAALAWASSRPAAFVNPYGSTFGKAATTAVTAADLKAPSSPKALSSAPWPAYLLAASSLAAAGFRSSSGRRLKQPRVVATRSFPVAAPTVTSKVPPLEASPEAFLSFAAQDVAGLQDLVVVQEPAPREQNLQGAQLVMETAAMEEPSAEPVGMHEAGPEQAHEDHAHGRQDRRRVGAKLMEHPRAEPQTTPFEPSKVPLKMQRGLQLRTFPGSGSTHEGKTSPEASGLASLHDTGGLQSFNIQGMVATLSFD